jgi:hypothetical protein
VIDCGVQVASLLKLVLSLLKRTEGGVFPHLTIAMRGMNRVVCEALQNGKGVFTPTDIPPLELALVMAAHCRKWKPELPMFADALDEYVN